MTDTAARERQAIPESWWDACLPDGAWDDEVQTVNRMMDEIDDVPEWAMRARGAMPKWGFEMCAHRWLDGLDHVVGIIARAEYAASEAGHCGDVPTAITQAADRRADAGRGF